MERINKCDYEIRISHIGSEEYLFWEVKKKGMPHHVSDNIEELILVKKSCEEVIFHVNMLLNKRKEK